MSTYKKVFCLVLIIVTHFGAFGKALDTLEKAFLSPPDSAKPRVYWFWLFNRVDKAGITRDLEQFKAKGISGVNLICSGGYGGPEPLPGVKYQSPEWWELFRHTVKEAKRVNIELGFNLSGSCWVMIGPWVTHDNAMKKVVQADLNVEGPKKFSDKLPQPPMVDGYYRDYCVQAFPQDVTALDPKDIIDLTDKLQPDGKLEWNVPAGRWTILRTGYTSTGRSQFGRAYPYGDTYEGGEGYDIDFLNRAAFDDHFKILGEPLLKATREAGGKLAYFWSDSWECGKLTWTQDFPKQFRKYRGYDLNAYLPALQCVPRWKDYTATFTATSANQTLSFEGTSLSDHTIFIDNVQIVPSGGASVTVPDSSFETPSIGAGNMQYNPTGGSWTFGGSPGNGSGLVANGSGFENPSVPQGGQAAFVQGTGTLSQALSGLVPGTNYTLTYQAVQRPGNAQTWSIKIDNVVKESSMTGKEFAIVNDEVTARFRADFDRTIQDCLADNFYGHFADVCHQNNMIMGSEAAGPGNLPILDALKNLGRCDFPAGEFWVNYYAPDQFDPSEGLKHNLKQTSSAAHVYGRIQVQAESFTQQQGGSTHWSFGPSGLKPYANDAFCWGVNRIMLHESTCQPPSDGKPGYELCAGQHFTPNITWWEQSPEFFTYLSRCSYMLQQGNFVGDVCFYLGEEPSLLAPFKYNIPGLGSDYDCDYSNAEVLLTRMAVKDGRIVLPDGMSYRLLVLQNCASPVPEIAKQVGDHLNLTVSPTPSKAMSVEVIKKLRELIRDGATVIGAPPEKAVGLKDYPKCDAEVKSIAAEIWGDLNGINRTERRFGKGRIIWGKTPREVLLASGIKPDFVINDGELSISAWIWHAEDGRGTAPACKRFFKTEVTLPATANILSATLDITADDQFVLEVNNSQVAQGNDWKTVYSSDLSKQLHGGNNKIQVTAENAVSSPAGLLARLTIRLADGTTIVRRSDKNWLSSSDGTTWAPALEIGTFGCSPWGTAQSKSNWGVPQPDIDFIHRTSGDAEIYYVVNRKNRVETLDATFRVAGKQPEIFDPVSGSIRSAKSFRQSDGCTQLPLEFERFGAYFVVFRKPIAKEIAGKAASNFPKLVPVHNLDGTWNVKFDTEWGGPANAEFPELVSWTKRPEEGIKFYSGKATYRKTFDVVAAAEAAQTGSGTTQRLFLDLGHVREVAEVRLNGKNLGILWCSPWRVEITEAVKPVGNELEIDVINLWPNRVIRDLNLPKEKRFTKTHDSFRMDMLTKDTSLIESGLLGPVTVQQDEAKKVSQ